MPSTYSPLKIELIADGEQSGTWGGTTNTNLGTALEEAIVGSADVVFTDSDVTLTLIDSNASQTARCLRLNLTGTISVPRILFIPAVQKQYIIKNNLTSAVAVAVSLTGLFVVVPSLSTTVVYSDGTDVFAGLDYLPALAVDNFFLSAPLSAASGGTGISAPTANAVLLGNGTSPLQEVLPGTSGYVLTSDGTTWISAPSTGGGGGGGSGTVTSVDVAGGTTGLSFTGGPITASGTITMGGTLGTGSGGTGSTSTTYCDLAANVTGTLPVLRGGTGQTTYTNGQLLIGRTTGGTLIKSTLTPGTGISITNGAGSITIDATNAGTVTDVLDGAGMNFTSFTTAGTITLGTPSTLTTATTNATTASSHTHAITVPIPASYAWTDGTTAGPTGSLTVTNSTAVSYPAIPSASASVSGVVTTGNQTWAGTKTFSSIIAPAYNFTVSTSHFGSASSITSSVAGVSLLNVTGTAVTCSLTNRCTLGSASILWGQIYSSVATISTSDGNYKQDIAELDAAEKRVAVAIKGLIKKFRFIDAVAEKGAAARIHVGVIAQEVQAAFSAEGLDANRYGLFCSDTWWEKEVQVERNGVTSTEMLTSETPTEGYTERTRLGMRYEELLAFVISAM